jgi:hypothetical protein
VEEAHATVPRSQTARRPSWPTASAAGVPPLGLPAGSSRVGRLAVTRSVLPGHSRDAGLAARWDPPFRPDTRGETRDIETVAGDGLSALPVNFSPTYIAGGVEHE